MTYPDLLLRPWSESDARELREAIDEDLSHLKPWLTWTLEEPATLERTRTRLLGFVDEYRAGEALRYAITPMERPSRILGGAHLKSRVGPAALEAGYWVRASAVRQGIAAAVVSRLVLHAFEERAVERLIIRCDVANGPSAAFARALGFALVRTEAAAYPDGTPRPVDRFELSREGYDRQSPELRDRARRVRLVTGTDEGWLASLAELDAGHARLESLAAGVAESERETAGACGVWSARQLLAHLEAWNVEILGNLRRLRDGGGEVTEHDVDEFNRRAVRAREGWEWTTVTTRLRESQRSLRRHVLASADEGPGPTGAEREWLEVLVSHDRHHAAQLARWLGGGDEVREEEWIRSDGVVALDLFERADAEVMAAGDADPEHRRRFGLPEDFVPSVEHAERVITGWADERRGGERFTFAVRDASTGELLGGCELLPLEDGVANLSYWTYPPHRRRGVASRAVGLLCDFAREETTCRAVEIVTDGDNVGSRQVALRNGFTEAPPRDGRRLYILELDRAGPDRPAG